MHELETIITTSVNANVKAPAGNKRARYKLEAAIFSALAGIIPLFSRSTVVCAARGLGWVAYYLLRRERRIAHANLDTAFGESKSFREKKQIARASLQNIASTLLALFWAPNFKKETVDKWVECDPGDLKRVLELQSTRRGIIFLTLHYGDWEIMGLAAGYYGLPMTIVMEDMRNGFIEDTLKRLRSLTGHKIITQRSAATKLFRALKKGGNVALLIDLNAPMDTGGVWLDFFGKPVFNNAAVAALALRTGAIIVCSVAFPLPGGRARIVYGPEIDFQPTDDNATDLRELSQKCLNFCEDLVRRTPEHWLWTYKRWKHCPTPDRTGFPFYTTHNPAPPPEKTSDR